MPEHLIMFKTVQFTNAESRYLPGPCPGESLPAELPRDRKVVVSSSELELDVSAA
jgi:hypothetical protein